jgi:HSP20 family protein
MIIGGESMFLTSIDPFFQEVERHFDRLSRQAFGGWGDFDRGGIMPMDAVRRKDDVLLRFDTPGIDPDSIEVTVDRGVLTVSARRDEERAEGDRPFVRERVTGSFTRQMYLSEHLDPDKIEADYANGVLSVRVPVLESAKPRKISIRRADKKALKA